MSNREQTVQKRITALRREAAGIYGNRYEELNRVRVEKKWEPLGKTSAESIFSQIGGGRRSF